MTRILQLIDDSLYIVYQCRHMLYHILVGILWTLFLQLVWGDSAGMYILLGAVGAVLPDLEHLYYFFGYGRHDGYVMKIFSLFKHRDWRELTKFIAIGHKYNTSLIFHNIYTTLLFIGITAYSADRGWLYAAALFGAMASHYVFDIVDDMLTLGKLNENWYRWGGPK